MRRLAAVALTYAVTALVVPVAAAHDHRAPRASMVVGSAEQAGRPLHSAWFARAGKRFCDIRLRRGLPSFPRALPYSVGDEVAVVLHKSAPPLEIAVEAWREVDAAGRPQGTADPVPAVVTPVMQGSTPTAWEIRFVPDPTASHLYLTVEAYWADEDGCTSAPDLGSQSAAWTFHLAQKAREQLL